MRLKELNKLLEVWEYALDQGANVVLMRHAPKAGSDKSGLSNEGIRLAELYGRILSKRKFLSNAVFIRTDKPRTADTLKTLFPNSSPEKYEHITGLNSPRISTYVQEQVNRLHAEKGHWRGYCLNHTYYFLEELGGEYDEEYLHGIVAERMAKGIKKLFEHDKLAIYCGHSPSIEVGCQSLLGISLGELGGFLNPLDSIHLRMRENEIEFVSRINPIIGYQDLESETYYKAR